jgi:hypothetical protein
LRDGSNRYCVVCTQRETLMDHEAALARPVADGVEIPKSKAQTVGDMRYAWVELSIVEAKVIAAEAMLIVAKSREVCLYSRRGLMTTPPGLDVVVREQDEARVISSSPADF